LFPDSDSKNENRLIFGEIIRCTINGVIFWPTLYVCFLINSNNFNAILLIVPTFCLEAAATFVLFDVAGAFVRGESGNAEFGQDARVEYR